MTFPSSTFHLVLVHPEIPHNTGAIGRLCLATNAVLHLIKPLGFDLSEKALRRAGLDYWKDVDLRLWESTEDLLRQIREEGASFYLYTTKVDTPYWDCSYRAGDYLLFGSETRGLPESLLAEFSDHSRTVPMHGARQGKGKVRSLNLATTAGLVLYEGIRQISTK